jgi:hypothetical protein
MAIIYRMLWSFRRWRERVYFLGQRVEVLRAAIKVIIQAGELDAMGRAMERCDPLRVAKKGTFERLGT